MGIEPMEAAPLACLDEPAARGLARLRAWLVDRLKRRALKHLHRTRSGELLVLRMCLIAERATEATLHEDLAPQAPDWLQKQIAWHLAEEQTHVRLFADEITKRGAPVDLSAKPDWISARKIARWRALALRYAPRFQAGVLVPTYAVGMCAEQMATRVVKRHVETIGDAHPLAPVLHQVLHDEDKHVRLCRATLQRAVRPAEQAALAALLAEVRAIDRGWGVRGALWMYAAGLAYRLRPGEPTGVQAAA